MLDELTLWEVRKMPDNTQGQRTTVLKSEKKKFEEGLEWRKGGMKKQGREKGRKRNI